jgi:hypothetical protein
MRAGACQGLFDKYLKDRFGWRIIISLIIPQSSPSDYDSAIAIWSFFFIHFIAIPAPGGVRSIIAESLLKHQLLIVNCSRQRSPNLCARDCILAGLMALMVPPTCLLGSILP